MYKMLVVDDEYLVRLGIEQTIDWKNYDIQIIGSAKNGKEGLNMAIEHKPDIIISDVRMPIMDGLELTKAIQEKNLDTIVIIFSGYKDFEYAKETLENGAFQYLLKPIDNQQLIDCVLKALSELERNRIKNQKLNNIENELPLITTTILQNLISGNYTSVDELIQKIKIYNLDVPESGLVIYSEIDQESVEKSYVKKANIDFYHLVAEDLTQNNIKFVNITSFSHFVLLVKESDESKLINILNRTMNKYEETHEEILSIGLSELFTSIDKIHEMYLIAKKNAKNKLLLTMNTITTTKDTQTDFRKQVVEIIRYISKNYQFDLSIEGVANHFQISPSHLMHIFKEDVGKTFNECLAEYRIKIAKKLMMTGKYRIYEIASMVGYRDTKYFSQVFRKFENLSPAEFVAIHQKQ